MEGPHHLIKVLSVDDRTLIYDVDHQAQTHAAGRCPKAPGIAQTVFLARDLVRRVAIFETRLIHSLIGPIAKILLPSHAD